MEEGLLENLKITLEKSLRTSFPQLRDYPLEIEIDLCEDLSYGDFSSNIAFKLVPLLKNPPQEIGKKFIQRLEEEIENDPYLFKNIKKLKLYENGFINFFLTEEYLLEVVRKIIFEGDNFGSSELGKDKSVLIEFVSANPTGPLSIAHGRQAAIGDALANIFSFLGYKVEREYYINDEGIQMENLGKSIWTRYRQLLGEEKEFPEAGYKGEYIIDIAKKIPLDEKKFVEWDDITQKFFIKFGCNEMMKIIKEDLTKFEVRFDNWISQSSLIEEVKEIIEILRKKNFIYFKDGAFWLKSTEFGDDKDRVVVKSDGTYTYIASDIAYHRYKYRRGFNLLINLWGPDHHGYIPRLFAGVKALGHDTDKLKILIVQLATIYKDGKPHPISTRAGTFITLNEVIEEMGKDVAKFFFLNRRLDSHLDFDIEIARRESGENPVYYIQYAYARISSLKEYAKEKGISLEGVVNDIKKFNLFLKNLGEEEIFILRILQQFPYTIVKSAYNLEPNVIIVYLQGLAKAFHKYYSTYRIVDSELEKSIGRVIMALAVGRVIRNGLRLLGISFPEKM